MTTRIESIFRNTPPPTNKIYIAKKNILKNIKQLQKIHPQKTLFPVVKANAYGHGLEQMCKILDKISVPYLCVDNYDEYKIVKKISKKNILLLKETHFRNYKFFDTQRTTFCISNIESLKYLGKMNKKVKIHLVLNTGMNREGIKQEQLEIFLIMLKKYPKINLEGVVSYLYDAHNIESNNYENQCKKFKESCYTIINHGYTLKYKHISGSAGFFRINDPFFNSARIGLTMYGYNPFTKYHLLPEDTKKQLKNIYPALRITSNVITQQKIGKNEGVSYDHIFKTTENEVISATLPFGYQEGLPISASGKIYFKYKKKFIKQIGKIGMNSCCCLTEGKINYFSEIEIIGHEEKNSLTTLSEKSKKSPYEILIKLDPRITREIE